MIKHYLTLCYRNLKKYKSQSIISIVGLSIGFLSFILCNYYVQYHLYYNTQIPNASRIYTLTSDLTADELNQAFPEIEKVFSAPSPYGYGFIGTQNDYTVNLNDKDVALRAFFTGAINPSFLDFFSLTVVHGTKEMITRTDNGVVLFESAAKKLTDNLISLIGKELELDGTYIVTGILKDLPENTIFGKIKDWFLVVGTSNKSAFNIPGYKPQIKNFVQINKNVSGKAFENKVVQYFEHDRKDKETEAKYELNAFAGLANFSDYNINIFKFLSIFGLLIMLATLINFVLFQYSMYYNQLKEYGIRIVNGVNRQQFALQLFTDIVIRFLLSCIIVFFIINTLIKPFEKIYYDLTYIHLYLPLIYGYMFRFVLYGALLSLAFSGILSYHLLRKSVHSVSGYVLLKNNRNWGRNIMLMTQLVVIILFISAAAIVKLQQSSMKKEIFSNMTRNERENTLSFNCNYTELHDKLDILTQKLLASQYLLDVTHSEEGVIRMWMLASFYKIRGIDEQIVRKFEVSPNFIDFFHGRLIQGRTFENESEIDAVIVNKNFMKLYPGESLIGKNFTYVENNRTYRIIGVMDNIQLFLNEFNEGVEDVNNIVENEAVFLSLQVQKRYATFYAKCQEGKIMEAKKDIEACLYEFIPATYQVGLKTLQENVDESYSTENLITFSSILLFVISLILGLLNIYSSVLMSVEKRQKEIAIRKINGAVFKDILILFSKTYFRLWTIACIIAFPLIYYCASLWLERYKNPVTVNVLLFVLIYVVILAFILSIIDFRIIKAAKTNPAEIIKKE